jgi:serine/threonine protein kinase
MNDWNTRVNDIFLNALEKATERSAYLDTACGDDVDLRRAVDAMLTAHEKAGSFLDGPLPETLIAVQSPTPPDVFGRYRLKGVLGQGGMGRVYLAFDTVLERDVALKVPHASEVADPVAVKRFYREARVAAGFTDPHLCPVFDVGEIDGVHYLTMPLLRGETLAARLQREGRLPQMAAARIALAVARGLQVAHQAGVLHRDLKPANILLDEADSPIVMDFGLARRTDTADRLTKSGMTAGTPAYLAPEQIGGGDDLGPATDVYSLGAGSTRCSPAACLWRVHRARFCAGG